MRISTLQMFNSGLQLFGDKQANLAKYQEQIATGKKLSAPQDDPLAAVRSAQLTTQLENNKQYIANSNYASSRLNQAETALNGVNESLQRIQELAIQGRGLAVTARSERETIASEMETQLKQLVQYANYQDSNGEYIFAGSRTLAQPFVSAADGTVTYVGDQTNRSIQISDTRHVQDSNTGFDVFLGARKGNGLFAVASATTNTGTGTISPGSALDPAAFVADTYTVSFSSPTDYVVQDSASNVLASGTYTAGKAILFNGVQTSISGAPAAGDTFSLTASPRQSMFGMVNDLIQQFRQPTNNPVQRARFDDQVVHTLTDLEQTMEHLGSIRSSIGVRMKSIEGQQQANEDYSLDLNKVKVGLEDVDIVEATALLSRESTALQVAQQAFAKLQSISLFNYIS